MVSLRSQDHTLLHKCLLTFQYVCVVYTLSVFPPFLFLVVFFFSSTSFWVDLSQTCQLRQKGTKQAEPGEYNYVYGEKKQGVRCSALNLDIFLAASEKSRSLDLLTFLSSYLHCYYVWHPQSTEWQIKDNYHYYHYTSFLIIDCIVKWLCILPFYYLLHHKAGDSL